MWAALLRKWKLLSAAIASLWPAKQFVLWALDWRGRYDAAIQSYNDLGGWHAMIGYILNPPPWFYFPAFCVSIGLILWHFRAPKQVTSSSSITKPLIEEGSITLRKNSPIIKAGGNVNIGHIGDVFNQAPEPEVKIIAMTERGNGEKVIYDADIEVISPYPIGSLLLYAKGQGLESIDATPMRVGPSIGGQSGIREDGAFTTIMHAFGRYRITIHARHKTSLVLEYSFNS
ncbi:hypothetical protein [Methylocystis sp.]|uniref:hypothetical protein n=1 Tax=Methylocystis sp. TaxID=1911079 RepID=UPI0025F56BBB|nr:hypothetical protein [Methylocystis sp.]